MKLDVYLRVNTHGSDGRPTGFTAAIQTGCEAKDGVTYEMLTKAINKAQLAKTLHVPSACIEFITKEEYESAQ